MEVKWSKCWKQYTTYTNTGLSNNDAITCTVTPDLGGCSSSTYTSNLITVKDINQTVLNEFYITGASASSACKEAIVDVVWRISNSSLRNTLNGNSLTKLTSDGAWNGNAFSYQSVGNNGYMQTTIAETNKYRIVGLSSSDLGINENSIQYAFLLVNNGTYAIYESGNNRAGGTYAANDILKIAVENNVVKYYKNGTAVYISTIAPALPLYVDVSTYNTGATISNVKISNGNISTFTAVGTNLGTAPTYQWKLNGVNVGSNSTTYTNTSLANNDAITCTVTPDLGGCSSSTYTSNLITVKDINQTALNEFYITGSPASSACKEAVVDVVWVIANSSLRNTLNGNSLTKLTSDGAWNGNAFSYQSVGNNGYMQTTIAETNKYRIVGLSSSDLGINENSIQYAFLLVNNGTYAIYESGNNRAGGTYAANDILKIAVENNVVKYYKNGTAVYISTITPTLPLYVDVSTYNTGATVSNVKISNGNISTFTAVGTNLGTAPTYQWKLNGVNVGSNSTTYTNTSLANNDAITCTVTPDLGGCSSSVYTSNSITVKDINQTTLNEFYITGSPASSACKEAVVDVVWVIANSSLRNTLNGNSLTKLTSDGAWDGNAFSYQSVGNNGYMQTTVSETNKYRIVGLSSSDLGINENSIQYAFLLVNNGTYAIYESGNNRAGGTYAANDILKIAVENNVVKYYKNGTAVYISAITPTLPLYVDASTYNTGATVSNVKISNGNISTFTAVGTNLGTAPTYQWKLNGVNVGSNSTTYTNTSLANNDVITCEVTPDLGGCSSSIYTSNAITVKDINQTLLNDFYITGAAASSVCKESLEDVVWKISSSATRNTISANTLTKLTSDGAWNGNGFSYQAVYNNGYMQTTVVETNKYRIVGLSSSDLGINETSIQYAFLLVNNGTYNIYESGNNRAAGTYAANDILKIAVENSVVKYYKNNVLVYISTVVPAATLYVDACTYNTGATISNVKISNGNISSFTAVATNAGTSPTYQWKLNGGNVGTNSPNYSNASLVGNDIVTCLLTPDLGGCSTNQYSSNNIVIQVPGTITTNWLGGTNAWNTPGNWSNGVPTKYSSVTITAGTNPVISSNAIAYNVTIGAGKTLTISGSNTLEVFGNWNNQGTFTPNTSTVKLSGCATSTLSSTAAETFYNLIVNNVYNISASGTHTISNNINFLSGIVTNTGTINIANGATATNASNVSYIDGPCRKTGNSSFTFPIGKNGNYRPCSISAPGNVADHFTAQYFEADPYAVYPASSWDAGIDHLSGCEYWILNRTNGTSNVNVTLTWNTNSCGVNNLSDLRVARYDSGTNAWRNHGNGGTTGNTTTGTVITSAAVTTFSPFTLASASVFNPLPVELLEFTAIPNGNKVDLVWKTATEINNDFFTIEKSKDGINFTQVLIVNGAGNSNSIKSYSAEDINPYNGISYYRLKQTDYNGKYKYAAIVNVDMSKKSFVAVYPNPASTNLFVNVSDDYNNASLKCMDALGREVISQSINSYTVNTINTEALSSGIYSLIIENGNGEINRVKVIIQK